MKLVIASDIHGSATYARMLFDRIAEETPDFIVLLGDLLYHGPRNNLPAGYAPREVFALLNEHAKRIIAVRGNCDAEVDQMVLDFPCMDDAATLHDGDITLFLTHGHVYAPEDAPSEADAPNGNTSEIASRSSAPGALVGTKPFPALPPHAAFLSGHTHVKVLERRGRLVFVNPGSVSLPKDGSHSFATYHDGTFKLKALSSGHTLSELEM